MFPAQDLVKSGHLPLKIHTSGVQEHRLSLLLQISYSLNPFAVIFSVLYSTSDNFLATCTVIIEPLEAQVHISYRL
ncbi:hypothetical protein SERLA73DRAFT_175659, partial [Serpula lacrymans var. lacrymans S7.3]